MSHPPSGPQPYRPRPYRAPRPARKPLGTGETAAHLILTFFTGGIWGIVWFLRSRASRARAEPRRGYRAR